MSALSRFVWSVVATLFGVGLSVNAVSAQMAGSGSPYNIVPNQLPYNTSTLGKDRPLGYGYSLSTNPYTTTVASVPAVVQPTGDST